MSGELPIDPVIFRSLDIRGKVGLDINETVASILGKALGTFVIEQGGKIVFIGHDNRPSSPELTKAFINGLIDTGCEAADLGLVPTPVVYFASNKTPDTFGAMITASHLPGSNNGFKFCKGRLSLYNEINGRIKQIAFSGNFSSGNGRRTAAGSMIEDYLDNASQIRIGNRRIKVIVDCQNGAASLIAPRLMQKLGIDFTRIHSDINALYPFERPDPQITANLKGLMDIVLKSGADLGIAYDGDADRLGVVDNHGQHVAVDQLLALFAAQVLAEYPGRKIIYDALCSQVFVDEITRHGGVAVASRSGHAYVKDLLFNENGVMGGELSGHIFFADRYPGFDDGIYASVRLIELLTNSHQSLSEMLDGLPKLYSHPEERPHCPDEKKKDIIQAIENSLRLDGYPLETADGVRIQFPHGWGIIRASGTEPALSMRVEAETQTDLETYHTIVWHKLDLIGNQFGLNFNNFSQ